MLEPLTVKEKGAVRGLALYHLARGCFTEGAADKALEHLKAAGKADAECVRTPEALQFAGELYEKLGKTKEALDTYRRLSEMDGNADKGLLALIRLDVQSGAKAEALDHLRRYVVAVHDTPAGLLSAADYYLRLERWDDAFDIASKVNEQGFQEKAHRILGLVYRQRGDHAKAIFHLGKAEPDTVVLEALIRSHLALGQLHAAVDRADQAERLDGARAGLERAIIEANRL